jgi:DNA-binding LytR/AlgR family response regulator
MSQTARPTALIAEDEPLLAAALQQNLARTWPELQVLAIAGRAQAAINDEAAPLAQTMQRWHQLMQSLDSRTGGQPVAQLTVIQASTASGATTVMVPVSAVIYFEAADKYVRVLTGEREWLIRTPLKELLPQLDLQQFWQIHRSTVVRASAIHSVTRDEAGKLHLRLRGRDERLAVSRLYAHLFKPM